VNPAEVRRRLTDLARVAALVGEEGADAVVRFATRYAATLAGGGTLFFAGNGGSAAHAQHVATEYVVRLRRTRRPFRAVSLAADSSVLTAGANDLGFEEVFARQVEAFAGPADLLVLHSTTGRSENLLRAARRAREQGVPVVALLGGDGGPLAHLVDDALVIPSDDGSRIQELHLAVEHVIVELVERELGGDG
jgi:D-sedoheptulose 7-phosphate isomerase